MVLSQYPHFVDGDSEEICVEIVARKAEAFDPRHSDELYGGNTMTIRKNIRALSHALLAFIVVSPSYAQDSGDEGPGVLEEIVVTATRRSESINDIPVAVTALSAQSLRDSGISGLDQYIRMAPGASLTANGASTANLQFRGVATGPRQGQTQATVALYIDEFPADDGAKSLNTPDFGIFDIERIEMLRGPQGTLYGSGSIGGAIRIVTKKPDLNEFSSAFELSGGSIADGGNTTSTAAMINLPIAPGKFAVRAAIEKKDRDGWIDHTTLGVEDYNYSDAFGGRIHASMNISDSWNATASYYFQDREGRSPFATIGDPNTYTGLVFDEASLDNRFGNITVSYAGNSFDFTSSSTFTSHKFSLINDLSPFSLFVTGGPPVPLPYVLDGDSDGFIQEFRWVSKLSGNFDWTVGVFYSDRDRSVPNGAELVLPGLQPLNFFFNTTNTDSSEYAMYGEVAWQIANRWSAIVGGRAFRAESEGTSENSGLFNGNVTTVVSGAQKEDGFSPKFVLQYAATDSTNLYFSATRGFRTGDFNVVSGGGTGIPSSFDSDKLWNYELGLKLARSDLGLTTNIAVFYIDWTNIQIAQRLAGFNFTGNAGSAKSRGVEVEVTYQASDYIGMGASAAFVDAELTEDVPNVVQSDGSVGATKGSRLPGSPQETFAMFGQLSADIAGRNSFARLDYTYAGSANTDFTPAAGATYGPARLLNLNFGIDLTESVQIAAYGINILDSDDDSTSINLGPISNQVTLQPRTVGLTLRANF